MRLLVVVLGLLLLGACAGVAQQSEQEARQGAKSNGETAVGLNSDQYADYMKAARAANALAHISSIRVMMEEHLAIRGTGPRFLSDLNILYPEVNVPREIHQIRLAEEGRRIVALLAPDGEQWVSMRVEELETFPFRHWICELSFPVPEHALPQCDVVDGRSFAEMAPSFDCGAAETKAENSICRHDRLMDADSRLDQAFRTLQNMVPESDRNRYREEQREWLQNRDKGCDAGHGYANCLDTAIRERTSRLFRQLAELESPR